MSGSRSGAEQAAGTAAGAVAREERAAALFDRSAGHVYGLLLRMLGDRDAAEKILRDVYSELDAETCTMTEPEATASVLQLARAKALLALRSDRGTVGGGGTSVPAPALVLPLSRFSAAGTAARAALARMEPLDRKMLELAYFEGSTVRDLASRFGMSEEAVRIRLRESLLQVARTDPVARETKT